MPLQDAEPAAGAGLPDPQEDSAAPVTPPQVLAPESEEVAAAPGEMQGVVPELAPAAADGVPAQEEEEQPAAAESEAAPAEGQPLLAEFRAEELPGAVAGEALQGVVPAPAAAVEELPVAVAGEAIQGVVPEPAAAVDAAVAGAAAPENQDRIADPEAEAAREVPDAGPPLVRGPRVHARGVRNVWIDVACDRCGAFSGQFKLDSNPGGRD